MRSHKTIAWTLLTALASLLALTQRPHSDAQPPVKAAKVVERRELLGSASCSASVCHGGGEYGQLRSEATTFHALDPHARAYDVLLTPQSQAMARHLFGARTQAHDAPLCLKCHVHPEYEHARPNFRRQDGVGCESCHGTAQSWLTPHYRGKMSSDQKREAGFVDTKSLAGRANACVICHVGSARANVDHDLIAAGHPPLRFEFATYFANLPPHWDVAKDKRANGPNFETRAWAIGQFVSSATAFELLAHRADPKTGKIWPEFAELDCFACHHDLAHGPWRQSRQHLGARKPGSLAWSEWYLTMPSALLAKPGSFDFRKRSIEREELARHARDAARRLHYEAEHTQGDIDPAKFLKATAERIARDGTPETWDIATQHYLGVLALRQGKDMMLDDLIAKMRSELTFPREVNGPPPRFVGPTPKSQKK